LFDSLSGQLSVWRNQTRTAIKFDFQWRDFTSSCLQWLRAPSHATARRWLSAQPQARAPLTESSARILAAHVLRRRSLPGAGGSKVIGSLKKTPSFSTAILHWLQEPSHSLRERKPARASRTPLP
jgi:hypothetical protein